VPRINLLFCYYLARLQWSLHWIFNTESGGLTWTPSLLSDSIAGHAEETIP
jgi:hypothetical protein